MYKCKYCGKEFEKAYQLAGHVSMCKLNPNYEKNLQKRKNTIKKNKLQKVKEIKEFICICKKCGKQYTVYCTQKQYDKHKYKQHCSLACANSHVHTKEQKDKISKSLQQHYANNSKKEIKKKYITGSVENDEKYIEISKHKIIKWFKNLMPFGFDFNSIYTEHIIEQYYKAKNLIEYEYLINLLSPADIYTKYNCTEYGIKHSENILHIIKELGIKHRTYSDAAKNAYFQGKGTNNGIVQYHTEWHITWNNKKVFLRSSYEIDYANILDNLQIDYDVEALRIKYWNSQKNSYCCAIPDFYLKDLNTIVEIKSDYTLDTQEMKDKIYEYKTLGYKFKLILNHIETDINKL